MVDADCLTVRVTEAPDAQAVVTGALAAFAGLVRGAPVDQLLDSGALSASGDLAALRRLAAGLGPDDGTGPTT